MNAASRQSLSRDIPTQHYSKARLDVAARCNAELHRIFYKHFYAAIVVSALNAILVAVVDMAGLLPSNQQPSAPP